MASPQEVIFGRLKNRTGVSAILHHSTHIYPDVIPQGAPLPAITYSQISDGPHHAFGRDANIASPRFDVSIWSTSFTQVRALAKQVKYALRDYQGSTWGNVQTIFYEDETELTEFDPDGKRINYHIAQEYIIWHST